MSLWDRCRYALYLTIVSGTFIGLLIIVGASQFVGLLPSSAFGVILDLPSLLILYPVSFLLTPWLAPRLPIAGDRPGLTMKDKRFYGHEVRMMGLALLGVLVSVLALSALYLFERFS